MAPTQELLTSLMGQVVSGLLLIPVMWVMLKDLKTKFESHARETTKSLLSISDEINQIKLDAAGDQTKHDVNHLKKISSARAKRVEILDRAREDHQRQLDKIWTKIGDRPEDKQSRNGGHG